MRRITAWCLSAALLLGGLSGCGTARQSTAQTQAAVSWSDMQPTDSVDLEYAECFSVDHYDGGYSLITVKDDARYLVVPENASVPDGLDADIVVLQQPLDSIYLVSSSVMDQFVALDALDSIALSGTKQDGWYIDEAKQAMADGKITYAGKYSAPDYETIYSADCNLAIENTMIYHTPEVKEQLEKLGIPVFVERSSYEPHALGRMEWIKCTVRCSAARTRRKSCLRIRWTALWISCRSRQPARRFRSFTSRRTVRQMFENPRIISRK